MIITKGYKFRLYPNQAQATQIQKNLDCARFVYNRALDIRSTSWKERKESVTYNQTAHIIAQLKPESEYTWLLEADSMCLQESLKDLDKAYQSFFKHIGKYPKFKKKRFYKQSYRTRNQSNGIRIADDTHIVLPKLGTVKFKLSRYFEGRILNATISKTPTNKYFVSLCVEEELPEKHNLGGTIGIDVGIKSFLVDSGGNEISNPHFIDKYTRVLNKQQRKLSRMIEHAKQNKRKLQECSNIQKQRLKVAKIHEKIANCRIDFLHKLSTTLVSENQVISVEDLNVKGMMRNHKLAKSISDVSWSEFVRQLEYKGIEYNSIVVKIPRMYASSQSCSICGYKNAKVKDLSIRNWKCPQCGALHNRDYNAAVNILNKGLEVLQGI